MASRVAWASRWAWQRRGGVGSGVTAMARSATSGWTEAAARLTVCAIALLACGVLAGAESGLMTPLYAVVALACVASALWLDGLAGLGAGLLAAAAVVAATRVTAQLKPEHFTKLGAEVAALMVLGWMSGLLGQSLRALPGSMVGGTGSVVPAFHSLGLLGEAQAMLRLEEEFARSQRSRRPLGLLLVRVDLTDGDLDPASETRARRSVARLVESHVADTDIPFALSEEEIGAILPETGTTQGWRLAAPLLDAISSATFADRDTAQRRRLADCAQVRAGLVFAGARSTPTALLDEARRALETNTGTAA